MILLVGGTSETAPLALALADAGYEVLVSTATDVLLDVGTHPNISRRIGVLDREGMLRLAIQHDIRLIVDASHPYAVAARKNVRQTASALSVPYLSWNRPAVLAENESVIFRANHKAAAKTACSFGVPVLLTSGSRHLAPYVIAAERAGVKLVVRVLSHPSSLEACRAAGVSEENVVAGRGPFSVEDNLAVMQRFNIGVIVTKDSGVAGGVLEKIEAARIHGCPVVVVKRPKEVTGSTFSDVEELVAAVISVRSGSGK